MTMMTPAFSLNFTSATLDPRITFTRALATATRVNSSGFIESVAADAPRFDFDPVTLASKGLLIEEARTNLILSSNNFDIIWSKTAVSVTTDADIAPDGTLSADKLIPNTTNTSHFVSQSKTVTNAIHTVSVYAKADEYEWIRIFMDSVGSVYFNVKTGAVGAATATSYAITQAGNGWYRCSVTGTYPAGTQGYSIRVAAADNTASFAGDGTSGVYIWGGQMELGAFPTSYIPTAKAAAVTRNADIATITGTNFSDWWQAGQGGVLVRARPGTVSGTRPWVQFDDGTANEIITLRGNTTNPELYIVDDGVAQAQINAGTIAANTDYSMSAWWAANDCRARLDGGVAVTDLTAKIPTVTQMRIGSDGTNYLNGHIASIGYYDTFSGQIYARRKNKAVFSLV